MNYPRLAQFDDGIAMVVTDLHGEGEVYNHIRNIFLDLYQRGEVHRLIICGDLIHIRRDAPDYSLSMILDVMQLQAELGSDKVIMLLGNHEMPHIYNVTLSKGNEEYTAGFEKALTRAGKREEVYRFLRSLPFFVATKAGVLITHAGASPAVTQDYEAQSILTFDHDALLRLADDRIHNDYDLGIVKADPEYMRQATHFLALEHIHDPRFYHLLRGQVLSETEDEFAFLWDVLFARNEQGWTLEAYSFIAERFLMSISACISYSQNVLVAGHIGVKGGHKLIGRKHLRLASYAHAFPSHAGKYLLLDCAEPIITASDLVPYLRPVFE